MIVDCNIRYQSKTGAYVLLLQLVSPRVMFKLVFLQIKLHFICRTCEHFGSDRTYEVRNF